MQYLKIIQNFLNDKFSGVSYQAWLSGPNTLELYLSNVQSPIPLPTYLKDNKNADYTFFQDNNNTYLAISFDDHYQITLCFLGQCSSINKGDLDQLYLLFTGFYYSEFSSSNNYKLEKMMESIQELTSTLDLNELFKKIISNALEVIPAGDAGVFRLFDPETNLLVPNALVGFKEDYYHYKTKVGENVSGRVFVDRKPRMYHSREKIKAANNSVYHIDFVNRNEIAKGLIIVPVLLEEECIGTLAILQFSKSGKFSEKDLKLLQAFSSQVAIAYKNAKLYNEAQTRLETVEQLSIELDEKNQLLLHRIRVHDSLTQLSLKNRGIEKIIEEMNRILKMPVGYVDFLDNNVYWVKNNQSKITFDLISKVISNEQNVPVYAKIHKQFLYFYPIVVGSVIFGHIMVTLREQLSEMNIVSIEQSASVLALELVKKISLTELHYKKAYEYFNQLLESPDDETVVSNANQFNFKFSSHSFVVLCEISSSLEPYKVETRTQRLLSKINQELLNINKLVFAFHNKITLLISVHDLSYVNTIFHRLETIIKEWEKTEKEVLYGGIGAPYRNIGEIVKSYNEASKAISFLVNRNNPGLIRYEDIGVNRFFLNYPTQEIINFTEEIFLRLRTDKAQTHELEKTLTTYIASNKSAKETAEILNIHINTLYQRLRKIEERLELSFDFPEDMLKIHLACHLKDTFKLST